MGAFKFGFLVCVLLLLLAGCSRVVPQEGGKSESVPQTRTQTSSLTAPSASETVSGTGNGWSRDYK